MKCCKHAFHTATSRLTQIRKILMREKRAMGAESPVWGRLERHMSSKLLSLEVSKFIWGLLGAVLCTGLT